MSSKSSSIECRLCKSRFLVEILKLDAMPSRAQYFHERKNESMASVTNLDIRQCSGCGLTQIIGEPVGYYREVIRSNKVSGAMREFRLAQLSNFIKSFDLQSRLILEVGCGAGDILEVLKQLNCAFFGMEFNKGFVEQLSSDGYSVFQGYPNSELLTEPNLLFDAFLSFNVLEHAPDPKDFLIGLQKMLRPGAVGLIEVPNFDLITSKNMISEFMLEHLTYFTKSTLRHTLESSGFEVLSVIEVWHDYLISAIVRRRHNNSFDNAIQVWRLLECQIKDFLGSFTKNEICVWGAGHQSLASISILDLNEKIKFIVDRSNSKQGKYAPGSGIPIVSPSTLKSSLDISCVIVLGGSYSQEIIKDLLDNFDSKYRIITIEGAELVIIR